VIELHRSLAPISARAWERIEDDARAVLRTRLAARKLVDFIGPLGWEHSAIDLGQIRLLDGRAADGGALLRLRRVRPLLELRVPFELDLAELELIDRGAGRVELAPLHDAAKLFAAAEDRALFEGCPDADIPGIVGDTTQESVALPADGAQVPDAVTAALELLRQAGVSGPYGMALGPRCYAALEAAGAGYPVLRHVQRLLDGPIVWAPSLQGGVVLSRRGGDFRLVCGRDAAIGYLSHDEKKVRLYLEESFSAEINTPEAAVPLTSAAAAP
jgi:uncharacterized linocin/CFP29 family protein